MYVLWKALNRTKVVDLKEADLVSEKAEVNAECKHWDDNAGKEMAKISRLEKIWDSCW
jgi:amino acid transporter